MQNINQLKTSKMETKEQAKKLLLEFYSSIYSEKSEEERYRDARLCAVICQGRVTNTVLLINQKAWLEQQAIFDYLVNNSVETIIN